MIKAISSLCLSLLLVIGLAGGVRAAPLHPVVPRHLTDGAVVQVADSPLAGMNEVFHMDPPHLLFLGAGIVAGAIIVSPNLAVSELFGVAIGIVGSEFLYQTVYRPSWRPSHLF